MQPQRGFSHLFFLLALAVYAALLLPTLSRQGISWDEQVDLWIARSYLQPGGWLQGSELDPSQARLPMAVVALVYTLTGRDDLLTGRWVSTLLGALAIVGVYTYACRRFSRRHGLITAGLLASSPFYLSFARVAFTETDISLACVLAWLLVCLDRLWERPRIGRGLLVGLMLGLAIATKFTALVLIPVIGVYFFLNRRPVSEERSTRVPVLAWTGWISGVALVVVLYGDQILENGFDRASFYGLVLAGWLLPLTWAVCHRDRAASLGTLLGFGVSFGLLTALLFPPEHLTQIGHLFNADLDHSIAWRVDREMKFNFGFALEAAALHLLSIVFKSTPLIGVGLIAGWASAVTQHRRSEVLLLVLVSGGYFVGLLRLPIAQTFYIIPILPFLALLAADAFVRWHSRRRFWAGAGLILGVVWCGFELVQCYPDFNLNGYQWLGARPLFGRSSIGYRSVVQTPSDGVEQAITWLNENARPGEVAQIYALPWHIIRETAGDPIYRLQDGFKDSLTSRPDYVVLTINATIWQGWHQDTPRGDVFHYPFDFIELMRHYRKVYRVPRAFGIEAASVWQRK